VLHTGTKPTVSRLRRLVATRPRRVALSGLGLLIVAVLAIDVRLFVVPESDEPQRSDAIVVLDGSTFRARLEAAVPLAHRFGDSTLLVSTPYRNPCPDGVVPPSRLVCFAPDPITTQGEARVATSLAATRGWTSMTVVTTADQVWRARLRFSRCFDGELRVVQAPTSIWHRLASVPYEMGATVKAEVFQRGC
jgi:uncharacterized SAM-binding protein YcdF (DUF218 family)